MQAPVQVVRKIYEDLELDHFEKVEPLLKEATAKDGEFRKNAHPVSKQTLDKNRVE